jgi:Tfp pilus assembly protein PilV
VWHAGCWDNPAVRCPSTLPSSNGGFTLVEILVTVLILVTGLAGLVMMAIGSTRSSAASMNFNRATAYGEELLEELRQADYDDLESMANTVSGTACAAAGGTLWDVEPNDGNQVLEGDPGNPTQINFQRLVTVECLANSSLKRVVVEARWDDEVSLRRGSPHSIKFETYRSPDPL